VMLLFEFSPFTRDRRQYVHESLRDGIYLKKEVTRRAARDK